MIGIVDAANRALVDISIASRRDGESKSVSAWIDTAFDGHLVFPLRLVKELALRELAETEAILADGSQVALDTYLCYIDWFGKRMLLQVVANEGKFPLLGTGLLERRVLHVDYIKRKLSLE